MGNGLFFVYKLLEFFYFSVLMYKCLLNVIR